MRRAFKAERRRLFVYLEQLILGLNIPLGKSLSLQANAYYVYESWDKLGDFKFEDIEFGGYLSYSF